MRIARHVCQCVHQQDLVQPNSGLVRVGGLVLEEVKGHISTLQPAQDKTATRLQRRTVHNGWTLPFCPTD